MSTRETVIQLLESHLNGDATSINVETSLEEDLGYDSLDMINVLMELEDTFEMELPRDALQEVKTVRDLVELIDSIQ